jgi:Outer membrane protein
MTLPLRHSRGMTVLLALLLTSGCATVRKDLDAADGAATIGTSASPSQAWNPPPAALPAADLSRARDLRLPADLQPGMPLSLGQILDLALSNNPSTRIAWLRARADEAQFGSRRAAWLPEIDLNGSLVRSRTPAQNGRAASTQTTFGPSIALNQLLFDFGGRAAQVEQARATLISANLLHNQSIQDVILRAETAYYSVLDGKALLAAQTATIKERETFLDAAEARHRAGVATIADVLQARRRFRRPL